MSPTPARMDALRRFAAVALADERLSIESASADASFRRYWRVSGAHGARIVMDAPPDNENIEPWLDIGARLHGAGLHTPEVFALDRAQGFVLMEDLGARTYLPELSDMTADALYADALDALLRMQAEADVAGLPAYDRERLVAEMELLPEWFSSAISDSCRAARNGTSSRPLSRSSCMRRWNNRARSCTAISTVATC